MTAGFFSYALCSRERLASGNVPRQLAANVFRGAWLLITSVLTVVRAYASNSAPNPAPARGTPS